MCICLLFKLCKKSLYYRADILLAFCKVALCKGCMCKQLTKKCPKFFVFYVPLGRGKVKNILKIRCILACNLQKLVEWGNFRWKEQCMKKANVIWLNKDFSQTCLGFYRQIFDTWQTSKEQEKWLEELKAKMQTAEIDCIDKFVWKKYVFSTRCHWLKVSSCFFTIGVKHGNTKAFSYPTLIHTLENRKVFLKQTKSILKITK